MLRRTELRRRNCQLQLQEAFDTSGVEQTATVHLTLRLGKLLAGGLVMYYIFIDLFSERWMEVSYGIRQGI